MNFISWGALAPAVTAAFAASLVEVVEAFTIVLAVGAFQGWRPALLGLFTKFKTTLEDDAFHTVRVGLSYHFGSGYVPLK